jgi:hypothetical protein
MLAPAARSIARLAPATTDLGWEASADILKQLDIRSSDARRAGLGIAPLAGGQAALCSPEASRGAVDLP